MKKTSWTAKRGRGFNNAPVRQAAALHADLMEKDHKLDWQTCFDSYLSGWLACQRQKFAELRIKIKTLR